MIHKYDINDGVDYWILRLVDDDSKNINNDGNL